MTMTLRACVAIDENRFQRAAVRPVGGGVHTGAAATIDPCVQQSRNGMATDVGPALPTEGPPGAASGAGGAGVKVTRKLRKDETREGIEAELLVPAEALEPMASKTGWLQKRSENGLIQNWKRRWVVLASTLLYYYDSDDARKPAGVIQLDGATVQLRTLLKLRGKPESVMITTRADRVFYFMGASTYENASWLEAISAVPGVLIVTAPSSGSATAAVVHTTSTTTLVVGGGGTAPTAGGSTVTAATAGEEGAAARPTAGRTPPPPPPTRPVPPQAPPLPPRVHHGPGRTKSPSSHSAAEPVPSPLDDPLTATASPPDPPDLHSLPPIGGDGEGDAPVVHVPASATLPTPPPSPTTARGAVDAGGVGSGGATSGGDTTSGASNPVASGGVAGDGGTAGGEGKRSESVLGGGGEGGAPLSARGASESISAVERTTSWMDNLSDRLSSVSERGAMAAAAAMAVSRRNTAGGEEPDATVGAGGGANGSASPATGAAVPLMQRLQYVAALLREREVQLAQALTASHTLRAIVTAQQRALDALRVDVATGRADGWQLPEATTAALAKVDAAWQAPPAPCTLPPVSVPSATSSPTSPPTPGRDDVADAVASAVAAERAAAAIRAAEVEATWRGRLQKATAVAAATAEMDITGAMLATVEGVIEAERAGRVVLAERVEEAVLRQATEVATAELQAAVHDVAAVKDGEIAQLRAALAAASGDTRWSHPGWGIGGDGKGGTTTAAAPPPARPTVRSARSVPKPPKETKPANLALARTSSGPPPVTAVLPPTAPADPSPPPAAVSPSTLPALPTAGASGFATLPPAAPPPPPLPQDPAPTAPTVTTGTPLRSATGPRRSVAVVAAGGGDVSIRRLLPASAVPQPATLPPITADVADSPDESPSDDDHGEVHPGAVHTA